MISVEAGLTKIFVKTNLFIRGQDCEEECHRAYWKAYQGVLQTVKHHLHRVHHSHCGAQQRELQEGDFQSSRFLIHIFSDRKMCGLNSHYNPFYFNCDYCRVNYNYIGKLEQWDQDIMNIAKESRTISQWILLYCYIYLQEGRFKLQKKETKNKENPSPKKKTCQGCSVREYFKHVDNDIKEELKTLFRIDFEMFGYSDDDI